MFDADLQWFAQHKDELLAQYDGQFVAILNGTVVDSDADFEKLAERIYAKYGYRDFVMQKVRPMPSPTESFLPGLFVRNSYELQL